MLRTYYRIWVDAIVTERAKKGEDGNWKAYTMIPISVLQGLNLLVLLYIIRWVSGGNVPIVLSLNISRNLAMNTFLGGALVFFIPFVLVNYLLVFYNERYQTLLNTYKDSKGKLYRNYALVSIGIIVIPLLLRLIF